MLLAPYIHLVFAVDMTVKGFCKQPFAPVRKWNMTLRLATVGALYLATLLVAQFSRARDACFMSLYWYIFEYSTGTFAVLTIILAVITGGALIIFVKLSRSIKVDLSNRVTASRTVYYLIVAIASNVSRFVEPPT